MKLKEFPLFFSSLKKMKDKIFLIIWRKMFENNSFFSSVIFFTKYKTYQTQFAVYTTFIGVLQSLQFSQRFTVEFYSWKLLAVVVQFLKIFFPSISSIYSLFSLYLFFLLFFLNESHEPVFVLLSTFFFFLLRNTKEKKRK